MLLLRANGMPMTTVAAVLGISRQTAATAPPRRIATPVVAHREPMAPTTCVVGGAS